MVILLVDSDQKSLDREAKRLADCQGAVTVSLYDNANDAIDFARYNDVDIVYSRQTLSDMSSEELIRQIKQIRPRAEGHVLGYGEPVPLQVCQRANANRAEFDRTYSRVGNVRGSMSMKDNEGKDYVEDNGYEINRKGDRPMTERELRSLSRRELLELMIEQGKEIESTQEQYENDLDFLKSEHEKDLNLLREDYEKEIKSLRESRDALQRELDAVKRDTGAAKREADNARLDAESLRRERDEAREALKSRKIAIDKAGSIAAAALQINGIFEAAQAASQQYIENIKDLSERQSAICAERDAKNRAEAEQLLRETKAKCEEMEANSRRKCATMELEAKQRADGYWNEVSTRLQSFYDNHRELKRLLNLSSSKYDVDV